jgi:hypothetical protein
VFLFESNRLRPYSTRRVRQIIHQYAVAAGIEKRVYPHLFRHQIITFLTRKGIISPKLQLLSGHAEEKSLAIYRDLALADVSDEYEEAMRSFSGPLMLIGSHRSFPCVAPTSRHRLMLKAFYPSTDGSSIVRGT